ncbi:hypothetical protein GQ53DRAFT_832549 [Thozetella sp. PMI_491]|nr:hypothetical protein GQ53DRAFT_832549 [Thozetella sp. PMI_491]
MAYHVSSTQAARADNNFLSPSEPAGPGDPRPDVIDEAAVPPTTFFIFSLFPLEIRLHVWEFALLDTPRTLRRQWNNDKFHFALRGEVPRLLHVCRETRRWFLKQSDSDKTPPYKYELVRQGPGQEGQVFINWARDDVFIDRAFNISGFEIAQLERLRSLTMTWGRRPCWVKYSVADGIRFIRRFPHLEQLTLRVLFYPMHCWYPEGASDLDQECAAIRQSHAIRAIKAMVVAEFVHEKCRDPEWKPPQLNVARGEWDDTSPRAIRHFA